MPFNALDQRCSAFVHDPGLGSGKPYCVCLFGRHRGISPARRCAGVRLPRPWRIPRRTRNYHHLDSRAGQRSPAWLAAAAAAFVPLLLDDRPALCCADARCGKGVHPDRQGPSRPRVELRHAGLARRDPANSPMRRLRADSNRACPPSVLRHSSGCRQILAGHSRDRLCLFRDAALDSEPSAARARARRSVALVLAFVQSQGPRCGEHSGQHVSERPRGRGACRGPARCGPVTRRSSA